MTKPLCGGRMEQTKRSTDWSQETGSWIIIVSSILDGYKIVISKNLDNILKCSSLFVPLFDAFLKLIVLFLFRMKINLC